MTPTDLGAAIRAATARLAAAGVPSPRPDALALAAFALGVDPGEAERRAILGADVPASYDDLVAARARRVPLQHLTGRVGFRRLELAVGPGVFVPRPETEVLVGLAVAELSALAARAESPPAPIVVDLCAGSGAVALAVADEVPCARVWAVELSDDALGYAARNVAAYGGAVRLVRGDAAADLPELAPLAGVVDVVTCNPPYIPTGMVPVDPEVRDHDPELALYGESEDGLAVPRRMAARAAALLRPGGLLLMEHADAQGESLPAALRAQGVWAEVRDERDLAGRPRVSVARRA